MRFKATCSIVILSLLLTIVEADAVGNPPPKFADALNSPNWSCDYSRMVNLAHASDGSVASTVITMAHVKCTGRKTELGVVATYELACLSPSRDSLPDVKDCWDSSQRDAKKFSWESADLTAKSLKKSNSDKYGRKCVYNTPDKKGRVAYRIAADGSYDATCATPIACDNYDKGPKHWIVACRADQTAQKDGSMSESCPQPIDCVESELPITIPHASAELASFSKTITAAPKETVASKKKSH